MDVCAEDDWTQVARRTWGRRTTEAVGRSALGSSSSVGPAGVEPSADSSEGGIHRGDHQLRPGFEPGSSRRTDLVSPEYGLGQEMHEFGRGRARPVRQEEEALQHSYREVQIVANAEDNLHPQQDLHARHLSMRSAPLLPSQPNSPGSFHPSKGERYRMHKSTAGRACYSSCLSPCVSAALDVRAPCSFTFWIYDDGPEETLARHDELNVTGGSSETVGKLSTEGGPGCSSPSSCAPPAAAIQPESASSPSSVPAAVSCPRDAGRENQGEESLRSQEYPAGQPAADSSTPSVNSQAPVRTDPLAQSLRPLGTNVCHYCGRWFQNPTVSYVARVALKAVERCGEECGRLPYG